jgi:hypothetical protein
MEEFTKMTTATCLATISESEIQMIIQSLIDDTGSVDRAEKWIERKINQVHHDIMTEGLNEFVRSQTTPNKFWPH